MSTTKIDPLVQELWAARLRELDNDLQGTECLQDRHGKMCCLGVLVEIAVERKIIDPGVLKRDGMVTYIDDSGSDRTKNWYGVLPPKVARWAGIESNPKLTGNPRNGDVVTLNASEWNDSVRANFDEIADMVEAL